MSGRPAAFQRTEELVLIRSLIGLTRHEVLRCWALTAPQPAQFALF